MGAALEHRKAQQMVSVKFNVSIYTITAFRETGIYNDFEWKLLFRRTRISIDDPVCQSVRGKIDAIVPVGSGLAFQR